RAGVARGAGGRDHGANARRGRRDRRRAVRRAPRPGGAM
ncbi:MAG: hypothetical protein AVDCRST_MAG38-1474, partial [uncultured Solirubrobacteraceae bacterium]